MGKALITTTYGQEAGADFDVRARLLAEVRPTIRGRLLV